MWRLTFMCPDEKADQLIQSMDLSVNPCEDFFRFACGGWIEKHPIPSTKSNWNQFDALADEVNSVLKSKANNFKLNVLN